MNGVLVDTSVWGGHFRQHNVALANLLNRDLALTHPMIIGEIACGRPPAPRAQTLRDMGRLQMVQHASLRETMAFIERESLYGMGCGLIDMILLLSTLITPGVALWTLDLHLLQLAERFNVAYSAVGN